MESSLDRLSEGPIDHGTEAIPEGPPAGTGRVMLDRLNGPVGERWTVADVLAKRAHCGHWAASDTEAPGVGCCQISGIDETASVRKSCTDGSAYPIECGARLGQEQVLVPGDGDDAATGSLRSNTCAAA